MIKVKETSAKTTPAKRSITVSGVRIENGVFVDEEGNIVDSVLEVLPDVGSIFDIKIAIELDDEEE